ncbi:hypothetical protein [Sphingomonas glacialis]|nr:hypothetical protein [Sphingomonas glacialis]
MFSKLAWDADVFREIQIDYPDEPEPLAFAAINVCISAWSLRNWTESVFAKQQRAAGRDYDNKAFRDTILAAIPEQAACDSIANTAKHATLGEGAWPGGRVDLEWQEGDEDAPPGYVLLHRTRNCELGFAVNRFASLCDHWWAFLRQLGMTVGHERLPDWQQRKLNRIFGRHSSNDTVEPDQKM